MNMKHLMDSFYELSVEARKAGNFEAMSIYTTAESYANNCHGMTAEQIGEHVTANLNYLMGCANNENERTAVQKCLDAVHQ